MTSAEVDADGGRLRPRLYSDDYHHHSSPAHGDDQNHRNSRTGHGQGQRSRPVSASSANTDGAGVTVKRQRSVQFSGPSSSSLPPPGASASASGGRAGSMAFGSREEQLVAESSSADEITPIFGRAGPKGGGGGGGGGAGGAVRDYKTQTPTSTQEGGKAGGASRRAGNKTRSGGGEASREGGIDAARPDRAGVWRRKPGISWKKVAEQYGTVELDNKGSVARDHLALERTFLAWLRTSLAFASIGIAVTQLFRLNTTIAERAGYVPAPAPGNTHAGTENAAFHLRQVGKPLGATFLGIAIVVLFVGFHRYFESQHWIIRGKFPASRGSVALVAIVAGVLIVGSLVVVVSVDPTVFERK